jgi:hypothetical protein
MNYTFLTTFVLCAIFTLDAHFYKVESFSKNNKKLIYLSNSNFINPEDNAPNDLHREILLLMAQKCNAFLITEDNWSLDSTTQTKINTDPKYIFNPNNEIPYLNEDEIRQLFHSKQKSVLKHITSLCKKLEIPCVNVETGHLKNPVQSNTIQARNVIAYLELQKKIIQRYNDGPYDRYYNDILKLFDQSICQWIPDLYGTLKRSSSPYPEALQKKSLNRDRCIRLFANLHAHQLCTDTEMPQKEIMNSHFNVLKKEAMQEKPETIKVALMNIIDTFFINAHLLHAIYCCQSDTIFVAVNGVHLHNIIPYIEKSGWTKDGQVVNASNEKFLDSESKENFLNTAPIDLNAVFQQLIPSSCKQFQIHPQWHKLGLDQDRPLQLSPKAKDIFPFSILQDPSVQNQSSIIGGGFRQLFHAALTWFTMTSDK